MIMTSPSYALTPSKSDMVSPMRHTIAFALSSLRLICILSRILKSAYNFSQASSQSVITVAPPPVSATLAPMTPYPLAPNAKLIDTKLMAKHHRVILNISPSFHGCMPCFPTPPVHGKCNTAHSTSMTPPR